MSKSEIMPGYFWRAAVGMAIFCLFTVFLIIVAPVPLWLVGLQIALWAVSWFAFVRAAKVRRSIDMEPVWEQARNRDPESFQREMRKTARPRFAVLGWVAVSVPCSLGAFIYLAVFLGNQ